MSSRYFLPSFLSLLSCGFSSFLPFFVRFTYNSFITDSASGPNLAAYLKAPSYKFETKAILALSAMGSKVK
jgi:hypothetical protein